METQDLVRLAQNGDDDARTQLFERYHGRVMAIVRRRLGRVLQGKVDPEDIAQSALVEALRHLDRFEPRGERALIRWLAGIVENKIRNMARVAKKDGCQPPTDFEPAQSAPSPVSELIQEDERQRLMRRLNELPEELKKVLLLREVERQPWKEVADSLGVTIRVAEGQYAKAKARLAKLLTQEK